MGPISLVYFPQPVSDLHLAKIDAVLAKRASMLRRTRKGRVWSAQIQDRPFDVQVDEGTDPSIPSEPGQICVVVAACCDDLLDHNILHSLSQELALQLAGRAIEPTK